MVKKNVEARLKIWLLRGREITHNKAQQMWSTNRLAEFIRRLRKKGHRIKTEMVYDKETGDSYGVYYLEQKEKVSRIKTTLK